MKKTNRIISALLCAVTLLVLVSCGSKETTVISLYEGNVSGAAIFCAEKTALINATAESQNKIADKTKIDMLFLASLDGVHDEKALDIISKYEIDKVYLPKRDTAGDRYSAISAAVDAKSGTVIEIDGAMSLPFGDSGIDLYFDTQMSAMTIGVTAKSKKALFVCGDFSDKCVGHLNYKQSKYDIVCVETGSVADLFAIPEKLSTKKLYLFTDSKNIQSLPTENKTEVLYSCDSALTLEY